MSGIRWGVVYLGMGDSELYLVSESQGGMPQSVPSSPRIDYSETTNLLIRNRSNSDAPMPPGERRPSVTRSHPEEKKEIPTNAAIVINNIEENNTSNNRRMSGVYNNNSAVKERSSLRNSADAGKTQPKADLSSNKTSNSAELPSRMSLSVEDKRKFLVHSKSKTDLVQCQSNSTAIKFNPPTDSQPHSSPSPTTKIENNINTNEAHWRKSAPTSANGRDRAQTEVNSPSNHLSPTQSNMNVHNRKIGMLGQGHPTKIWTRICGDNGTSRFLPFVGLGERHVRSI